MLTYAIAIGREQPVFAVGASTAICSVIGFDIISRVLRVGDQQLQGRRILITLGSLFLISMIPGVDFWGHFGSLAGGALIGLACLKPG